MSQCQVLYNNKPLEKVRHGKKMTLKDHDIKSSTTLVVTKPGITLSITDPKVSMTVVLLVYNFLMLCCCKINFLNTFTCMYNYLKTSAANKLLLVLVFYSTAE